MPTLWIVTAGLIVAAFAAYALGRRGALSVANGAPGVLHSLPGYHGAYLALWCSVPALGFIAVWSAISERVVSMFASQPAGQLAWELGAWGGTSLMLAAGY